MRANKNSEKDEKGARINALKLRQRNGGEKNTNKG